MSGNDAPIIGHPDEAHSHPLIPLSLKRLQAALDDALKRADARDMSIFVTVPHPDVPNAVITVQIVDLELYKYVDPGEVNYSLYITTTPLHTH